MFMLSETNAKQIRANGKLGSIGISILFVGAIAFLKTGVETIAGIHKNNARNMPIRKRTHPKITNPR